ncbi:MAG: electron transport complex subunit RsxA [Clostridiales bacterium]|jgi:electron transport complex protein RnfA|nr:electron transport complex subunit RsxA [Clostridiales bacterium]
MFKEMFAISITALLIQNVVLVKFLGICPFLGVSKKISTATGMGLAVVFVITIAAILTWCVNTFVLIPLNLAYLQTLAFILVIATLVQLVEMFLQKCVPALYSALGIYLPLITTNCAVLGVALLNIQNNYNFLQMIVYSISTGLSFLLAIVILAGIRERLETSDIPKSLQGFPITLITAGLMAIAFLGFSGFSI